jgi:hypothetical protein
MADIGANAPTEYARQLIARAESGREGKTVVIPRLAR